MFKTVRSVGAEIATLAYLLPSFWREAIAGEDQAEVKPTTREPREAAKAAWSSERGNMIDQKNTWNCFWNWTSLENGSSRRLQMHCLSIQAEAAF